MLLKDKFVCINVFLKKVKVEGLIEFEVKE